LDAGFAYNSVLASDKNRYGMAIRRKVDPQTHKLVDTNNSTNDFESMVKANPYYQFFK
jgi:possible lipoprotein